MSLPYSVPEMGIREPGSEPGSFRVGGDQRIVNARPGVSERVLPWLLVRVIAFVST